MRGVRGTIFRGLVVFASAITGCSKGGMGGSDVGHVDAALEVDANARGDAPRADARDPFSDGGGPSEASLDASPIEDVALAPDAGDAALASDAATILDGAVLDADLGGADGGAGSPDGGSDELVCNPSFGTSEACGGNAVGAWGYVTSCTSDDVYAPILAACAGSSVLSQMRTVSGTLELDADGTFARSLMDNVTGNLDVPAACASVGGCSTIEATIESALEASWAHCTTIGARCDCWAGIATSRIESGTYSTGGGVLMTLTTGAISEAAHYCVSGDTLSYRTIPSTLSLVGVSYVLTR